MDSRGFRPASTQLPLRPLPVLWAMHCRSSRRTARCERCDGPRGPRPKSVPSNSAKTVTKRSTIHMFDESKWEHEHGDTRWTIMLYSEYFGMNPQFTELKQGDEHLQFGDGHISRLHQPCHRSTRIVVMSIECLWIDIQNHLQEVLWNILANYLFDPFWPNFHSLNCSPMCMREQHICRSMNPIEVGTCDGHVPD